MEPIYNQQTPSVDKIENFDVILTEYAEDILNFAKNCDNLPLLGLAANQLSHSNERIMLNLCCVNTEKDGWIVAVNPEVYKHVENSKVSEEGCLTWPKKIIRADRYQNISVKYQTIEGEEVYRGADNLESIVWQHEINHLQGISEVVLNPKNGKVFGPSIEGGGTVINEKKIGRNSLCSCGSGKKYKKCCGK